MWDETGGEGGGRGSGLDIIKEKPLIVVYRAART